MVVKEITGDKPVTGQYLIAENQYRTAKNGTHFLAMKIGDQTGEIGVKIWDASEELYHQLEVGKVIEIINVIPKLFKDQIQLEWDGRNNQVFRIIPEDQIDYSHLLPHSPGNLKIFWSFLSNAIANIKEPVLQKVLRSFFDDQEFIDKFLRVPAALKRHHAYIGGLVEHTAGVTSLCLAAADYYPMVNRDLLITGAILHDIGKTKTYKIGKGFDGTDEGKLIGHLVLGVQMVERAFSTVFGQMTPTENEQNLRNQLIHLLVSHHGIMEWGSPIEPLTVEGCILHHADNMDAQITKFLTIMREHQSGKWAPFDSGLGRSIFLGKSMNNIESVEMGDEVL